MGRVLLYRLSIESALHVRVRSQKLPTAGADPYLNHNKLRAVDEGPTRLRERLGHAAGAERVSPLQAERDAHMRVRDELARVRAEEASR